MLVEAVVEIFTFDIVIEFFVKNRTKSDLMNVSIDLFAPTNLDIIEKAPPFSLAAHGEKIIRSCIKFSSTCNSYIFGQANYLNNKGAPNTINLTGIFILNASSPAICISFSAVFISVTTTQLIALDVEVFSIGA